MNLAIHHRYWSLFSVWFVIWSGSWEFQFHNVGIDPQGEVCLIWKKNINCVLLFQYPGFTWSGEKYWFLIVVVNKFRKWLVYFQSENFFCLISLIEITLLPSWQHTHIHFSDNVCHLGISQFSNGLHNPSLTNRPILTDFKVALYSETEAALAPRLFIILTPKLA